MAETVTSQDSAADTGKFRGIKKSFASLCRNFGKFFSDLPDKISNAMDSYNQTIREGTYGRKSDFVKRLVGLGDRKNKKSVHAVVGQKAMNAISSVLSTVGGKLLLGIAAAAVFSTTVAVGVGAAILGVGAVVLYKNHARAKERSRDVIEEVNLAGQKVKGTRSDLCRLRDMYIHLQNVENYVPEASTETPEELRAGLLKSVADEIKRVQVLDAGNIGASAERYSLPELENHFMPAGALQEGTSKIQNLSLEESWRSRKTSAVPAVVVAPLPADNKRAANPVSVLTVVPKSVSASK